MARYREHIRTIDHVHKPCPYCGILMGERGTDCWSPTRDHILARSKGGTNRIANITVCCQRCNVDKDNRSIEDWLAVLQAADDPRVEKVRAFLHQYSKSPSADISQLPKA